MSGFDVTTTAYGRPAVELLAGQLTALKAGDPLAPVTVVVPSNYAAVSTRRALAARPGGIAAVDFVTLHRLAERLGGPVLAAAGRRPTTAPVLAQRVRTVLADDPGIFEPVAGHPATERALVAATRELSAVTDTALDALAAQSPRAADVVRIARTVRAALEATHFDQHDLLLAATDAVAAGTHPGPVVVHLLQDLSPAGAAFLQALATATDSAVHVNVGLTGEAAADRPVLEAHARALIAADPASITPPIATQVISVSDPDEEVRAAVRRITQWMRDGIRLGRIAVLYGTADPYARVVHEQLTAAGINHVGAPVRDLGDMLLGRTLRSLLALSDRGFKRADVLAALTGAPLLGHDRSQAPSRAWERISRDAGVVDDRDWAPRLATYAAEQRALAEDADHEGQDRRAEHLRRDADRADELAAFVDRLRADLAAGRDHDSWRDLAAWVGRLVDRHIGDDRHRRRWPDDEREAAERVEAAVDRLGHLDAVGGPPPTVEVFRRTLDGELDVALRRVGRFGDGVLVGHVSMAVGLDLDKVIVLGLAEGAFPARRLEDSLLPDDERRVANGELALRTERHHDDHRHLLAAIAAAGSEAVLCSPRGDLRRSGERPPSRWLATAGQGAAVEDIPSFTAGLLTTPFPATAQDHRLAAMAADPDTVEQHDDVLAAGLTLGRARNDTAFTRFDGNLGELSHLLPDHTASGVVSASRLQTYAACPHGYFGRYLLRVEPVEAPERRLEMEAHEKGSLVHEILERFVAERIAEECFAPYEARGATGRAMFWRRDRQRILADLDRFLVEDEGRPVHAELGFDGVPYPLPDGRSVFMRGSVDRVDRDADGTLVVIDYKTGSTYGYNDLSEDDPHLGGTHLQLAMYAAAAVDALGPAPVRAYYWFTSNKGGFAQTGYRVTAAVRDDVGAALATIVDGIRAGVFPLRPSAQRPWTRNDCWYCSPDDLGTRDTRRAWERKRHDPAIAGYLALAEPEEVLDALDD
ncbi:MAG TPA: PD-(D/E)XK nuclease family protein [Acidimicrobiales bacterium]|nr:PD-(D/E)XK nuclease family protein [Acidimicrobiales bacterium]